MAVADEVTVSVAVPVVPGSRLRLAVSGDLLQPLGTVPARSKVAVAHSLVSILVTLIWYCRLSPGAATVPTRAASATCGLAAVQLGGGVVPPPNSTWTWTPLASAERVVIVTI